MQGRRESTDPASSQSPVRRSASAEFLVGTARPDESAERALEPAGRELDPASPPAAAAAESAENNEATVPLRHVLTDEIDDVSSAVAKLEELALSRPAGVPAGEKEDSLDALHEAATAVRAPEWDTNEPDSFSFPRGKKGLAAMVSGPIAVTPAAAPAPAPVAPAPSPVAPSAKVVSPRVAKPRVFTTSNGSELKKAAPPPAGVAPIRPQLPAHPFAPTVPVTALPTRTVLGMRAQPGEPRSPTTPALPMSTVTPPPSVERPEATPSGAKLSKTNPGAAQRAAPVPSPTPDPGARLSTPPPPPPPNMRKTVPPSGRGGAGMFGAPGIGGTTMGVTGATGSFPRAETSGVTGTSSNAARNSAYVAAQTAFRSTGPQDSGSNTGTGASSHGINAETSGAQNHLQRQLILALDRARASEARSVEAERRAQWAEQMARDTVARQTLTNVAAVQPVTGLRSPLGRALITLAVVCIVCFSVGGYLSVLLPVRKRVAQQEAALRNLVEARHRLEEQNRELVKQLNLLTDQPIVVVPVSREANAALQPSSKR